MDFAKKELQKYGWTEGEGLGKNRDGITKALKPKLKFDNAGLGHDISREFTDDWWRKLYDNAANNIIMKNEDDNIILESIDKTFDIKKRKHRKKSKRKNGEMYEGFIKTAELKGLSEKSLKDSVSGDSETYLSKNDKRKADCDIPEVSNEELFRICGGRTVHKGARHGLKMNAKLARLEAHENSIMSTVLNSSETKTESKRKYKYKC